MLPGVVGAISLLLALFAFQVLSVNYAGLALIALGVLLIIAESFVPSFGTLGLGGIVAFVIGSVMLLDDDVPGFGIAWQLIGAMALAGSLVLLGDRLVRGACTAPAGRHGGEALLSERAEAIESFDARASCACTASCGTRPAATPVRAGPAAAHPERRRAHAAWSNPNPTDVQRDRSTHVELCNAGIVVVVVLVLATQIFKVLNEYERGVVFTFGRFTGVKGPGLIILVPLVQKMVKVDLRVIVLDVPTQDVISRDNVSVKVNAVVYFRIVDPAKAIIQVANPFEATSQLAQTTLRSVLGQHELDDDAVAARQAERGHPAHPRPVDGCLGHQGRERRDQARRPEREHDPRDGEAGGSRAHAPREDHPRRGREAGGGAAGRSGARCSDAEPKALQLRYLQTLADISSEKTTTIVFPLPMDLLRPFISDKS